MFKGNMVTEAIPARVYALYRIVADNDGIRRTDLQNMMEPPTLKKKESGKSKTSYFNEVLTCASELQLVEVKDNSVWVLITPARLSDIHDMRLTAIRNLSEFHDTQFYKVTKSILEMNEKVFEMGGLSDLKMVDYLTKETGENITNVRMNAWRFWAEFYGFGYVPSAGIFIPNAYRFLKSILSISDLKVNTEYSFADFLANINIYGSILTEANTDIHTLNMALSNGLRQLEQNKEIELLAQNDRPVNYSLYPSKSFHISMVTAVIYKGVGK